MGKKNVAKTKAYKLGEKFGQGMTNGLSKSSTPSSGKAHKTKSKDFSSRVAEKMGEKFGETLGSATGKALGKSTETMMRIAERNDYFSEKAQKKRIIFRIKLFLVTLCVIGIGIGVFWFVNYFLPKHKGIDNPVYTVAGSKNYVGQNCNLVLSEFERMGFTNIEMIGQDDLVTGWINQDGEIDRVTIDGETFIEGEQFARNAHVLISYHSFELENALYHLDEDLGIYLVSHELNGVNYSVPEGWAEVTDEEHPHVVFYYNNPNTSVADIGLYIVFGGPRANSSVHDNDYLDWLSDAISVDEFTSVQETILDDHPALHIEAYLSNDECFTQMYIVDYGSAQAMFGINYYEENEYVSQIFNRFIESIEL